MIGTKSYQYTIYNLNFQKKDSLFIMEMSSFYYTSLYKSKENNRRIKMDYSGFAGSGLRLFLKGQ